MRFLEERQGLFEDSVHLVECFLVLFVIRDHCGRFVQFDSLIVINPTLTGHRVSHLRIKRKSVVEILEGLFVVTLVLIEVTLDQVILRYVRLALDGSSQIIDCGLLLTGEDVIVDQVLQEPRLLREAGDSILQRLNELNRIFHVHILLIEELIGGDSLVLAVLELLKQFDSLGVHLSLNSEDSSVVFILRINSVTRHLFLQFVILHHRQIRNVNMHLERFVRTEIVAALIEVYTVFYEFHTFVVLQHHLSNFTAHLRISRHFYAFLVEHRYLCQFVCLEPVFITLFYSCTFHIEVSGTTHHLVVVLTHCLFVTDHTCPVIGLSGRFLVEGLQDSCTSGIEIRGLSHGITLRLLRGGVLLCKAACAYQHESCQNQTFSHNLFVCFIVIIFTNSLIR